MANSCEIIKVTNWTSIWAKYSTKTKIKSLTFSDPMMPFHQAGIPSYLNTLKKKGSKFRLQDHNVHKFELKINPQNCIKVIIFYSNYQQFNRTVKHKEVENVKQ